MQSMVFRQSLSRVRLPIVSANPFAKRPLDWFQTVCKVGERTARKET